MFFSGSKKDQDRDYANKVINKLCESVISDAWSKDEQLQSVQMVLFTLRIFLSRFEQEKDRLKKLSNQLTTQAEVIKSTIDTGSSKEIQTARYQTLFDFATAINTLVHVFQNQDNGQKQSFIDVIIPTITRLEEKESTLLQEKSKEMNEESSPNPSNL
ncbi:MAG: hypothetical protein K0R24_1595 [Gammaproteobacteria bacterium]|jgi:hypothetical protein|nr:hypothetical protein [Gammaproteobacteria bacterium]